MESLPRVSVTTVTFNSEKKIAKFLDYLFLQDYPRDKLEVIFGDGGSKDKTKEIIQKYMKKYPGIIRFLHNKNQFADGKGMGKDMITRAARGDIIVIVDDDNILVQRDWISNMVKILVENDKINAVQSRLLIPKDGNIVDKYLNATGIEDPFAIPYSLNAQIIFHPEKFEYNSKGRFYIYEGDPENFLYAGGDGFVIRRKDFLKSGGYTQDIDNFYRMAKKKYKIAIPKDVKFHHQTSTEPKKFFKKRIYFVMHYLLENFSERDFYWFNVKKNSMHQNLKFFNTILYNLLFIPGFFKGINMAVKEKRSYWMIHPFMLFSMTMIYVYSLFYIRLFKKIGVSYN